MFSNFSKLQLFCTLCLLRNFHSGYAHHVNFLQHSLNHHFMQNCVYEIYSVFKLFEISGFLCTFGFYEISTPVMRTTLTMFNIVEIIISNNGQTVYLRLRCFQTFRNISLFCTFWLLRNFFTGDAHHANYGKHTLNHDFQHCANFVYQIYSYFKLFKLHFVSHILDFTKLC